VLKRATWEEGLLPEHLIKNRNIVSEAYAEFTRQLLPTQTTFEELTSVPYPDAQTAIVTTGSQQHAP
jgi:hypothetical protein